MNTKWDYRFLDLAEHVARWSKDPARKVGAVIVDYERRVIGMGYNGFPRRVRDDEERYSDDAVKLRLVVHAEANAILASRGSIADMTLYCTSYPCSECAKLIIQSGIARVFSPPPKTEGKWAIDADFARAMLSEATVMWHSISARRDHGATHCDKCLAPRGQECHAFCETLRTTEQT